MKITNGITEEELAQEICDTEEYQTVLAEKITFIHDFLQVTVLPLSPLSSHTTTDTSIPNSVETMENPSEVNKLYLIQH